MSRDDLLAKIAAFVDVSVDELRASADEHYTYSPGACLTCGSVYEDVHHGAREWCEGCATYTVVAWGRIADGRGLAGIAPIVRRRAYRAVPILRVQP